MKKTCLLLCLWLFSTFACNPNPNEVAIPPMPDQSNLSITPPNIQDSDLLAAFQFLYTHQEPIRLWDGQVYSGHDLAQFILDQDIPVIWDAANKCRSQACSMMYCRKDICTYEDGKPGIDPIYISYTSVNLGDDHFAQLVDTMAHEIFHRIQPFGKIQITQYEEFCACYLASMISGTPSSASSGYYNPLNPSHLKSWLEDMRAFTYFGLDPYPESINTYDDSLEFHVNRQK